MDEQTYTDKHSGKLKRPFQGAAQIQCRGYSLPLQRAITDFGADTAFGRVVGKMREHYGISLPEGAVVTITERHAKRFTEAATVPAPRCTKGLLTLVAEIDGSMIPIVETETETAEVTDRRKTRRLSWKEAKLSLVRRSDEIEPLFAVTLGDAAAAGNSLKRLAVAAGFNKQTQVHGLGDGAPWIADQIERQFGAQGNYMVDLYHVCDYLSAAKVCDAQPLAWMECQKNRLKTKQLPAVMDALNPFQEPDSVPTENAPVRQCYRYLANRPGQFEYAKAIADNLPIGSGEVESAHRYVIQERLKLPGAWWKKDNAQAMLNLRSARANYTWDRYWNALAA